MTEPRIERSLGDLTFRSPARTAAAREGSTSHFWTGVAIFLGTALVYPFYSYEVQTRMAARELAVAMSQVAPRVTAPVKAMTAAEERQAVIAARDAAAPAPAVNEEGVRVVGSTLVGKNRVVIAHLGEANLAESKASICTQAAVLFRDDLSGQRLRVQRHRGTQPAVEAGTITCD